MHVLGKMSYLLLKLYIGNFLLNVTFISEIPTNKHGFAVHVQNFTLFRTREKFHNIMGLMSTCPTINGHGKVVHNFPRRLYCTLTLDLF